LDLLRPTAYYARFKVGLVLADGDFTSQQNFYILLGDERAHFEGFIHEKMVVINFYDFCFENTKS